MMRKPQRERAVTGADLGHHEGTAVEPRTRALERVVDRRHEKAEAAHHLVHALQIAARAHGAWIIRRQVIESLGLHLPRHDHELILLAISRVMANFHRS